MAVARPLGRKAGVLASMRIRSRFGPSVLKPVLALALATASLSACGAGDDGLRAEVAAGDAAAVLEVVIPAGTGERMDRGEAVDLLPASELEFHVGDVLRIINRDARTHVVGPFSVLPGETLTQRFSAEGTYQGSCTVHPDGAVELRVLP